MSATRDDEPPLGGANISFYFWVVSLIVIWLIDAADHPQTTKRQSCQCLSIVTSRIRLLRLVVVVVVVVTSF